MNTETGDAAAGVCLRCGAAYEPGAIVCFTCGAPIGETETPTNPVPIIKLPKRPEAAQSPVASATKASTVVAAPPRADAPTEVATGGRTKRLRWPLALALSLLVVVLLGAGLYVLRGVTAAPPVARQTIYQDPQHHFRVQRPSLWGVSPTSDGVTLSDSDGTSTAQISVDTPTGTQETAKSFANTLATQLGLSAGPLQQIGGDAWEQRSGQVTGVDGAVREVVVYVTLRGGLLYTIRLSSPLTSFDGINTLVYQPLLASFVFG